MSVEASELARLILERELSHEERMECVSCGFSETMIGHEIPELWRPVTSDTGDFYVCSELCERRWGISPTFVEPFEWADLDED